MKFTEAKIRAINARWTGENYPLDAQVDSNFARNDILDLLDEVAAQRIENERLREALQSLYDEQNGPPIEKDKAHWYNAMQFAEDVLDDSASEILGE